MARRLARWTLRGIRAALAVVALAALVVWPWSYGHPGRVTLSRWATDSTRLDLHAFGATWADGRIGVSERRFSFDPTESLARREAEKSGADWQWGARAGALWKMVGPTAESWGPLWWESRIMRTEALPKLDRRNVSVPLWLLSLLAGAWPLASAVLFIRRRRRASLRRRLNLCRHCGYDLRATPSAGGATLATCPECGTPAASP